MLQQFQSCVGSDKICKQELADHTSATAADLQIHLRVPVTVIQDDNVCRVQVDAQASGTRGQQEDKLLTALCIVGVDLGLSVLTRSVAWDSNRAAFSSCFDCTCSRADEHCLMTICQV